VQCTCEADVGGEDACGGGREGDDEAHVRVCMGQGGDCESGHVAVMVRVVVRVSVSVGLIVMVIAWMSVGVVVRAGSVG
jgi:hypothetical protein